MTDGDDPGDATSHQQDTETGALPTFGRDRYTWDVERDRWHEKHTGWKFPIYDRALGKVVAVCCEQHMAVTLCKWLSQYDLEH